MKEEQYPKNFIEFLDQFKDEDSCRNYLFELKWSEGFHCPKCNNDTYWLTAQNLIHCRLCGHQTSLTAGTIFHGTRKPLILWFHVIWWVVAQKTGVSASNMTNFMGFGTYRTAWTWLQKLRRAMVRPGRDRLSGLVEVDETFIGGVEAGSGNTGRGKKTKSLVVVATECIGKQIGRVRFMCIDEASSKNLIPFIKDNIAQGSTVITDGWPGYKPLQDNTGYKHEVKVVFGSGKEAHELLPHVHMVDSLLKRWLNGTHQGKVSPKYSKYLPYYLDEFAFRFNRKMSTFRGKLFYRLMQQAVDVEPVGLNYIIENHT
ncbi:MAG TPA: IS1595 family transposase [Bacteroidales bacterium]|nr:IS1595 family transposase [Bacteroidales bacterium]